MLNINREKKIAIVAFVLGVVVTLGITAVVLGEAEPSVSRVGRTEEDPFARPRLKADFDYNVPEYLGKEYDLFEYVKANVDIDSVNPRSTEEIAADLRQLTHNLVKGDEMVYLYLGDENMIILLSELAAIEDREGIEDEMIEMLSSYYHGDVGSIHSHHNTLAEFDEEPIAPTWEIFWNDLGHKLRERAEENGYLRNP